MFLCFEVMFCKFLLDLIFFNRSDLRCYSTSFFLSIHFCLDNLSIGVSEALKLPTITLLAAICDFRFYIVFFMKYGTTFFL